MNDVWDQQFRSIFGNSDSAQFNTWYRYYVHSEQKYIPRKDEATEKVLRG